MDLQSVSRPSQSKPFAKLGLKPTCFYQNDREVFIPLANHTLSIFDIEKSSFSKFEQPLHEKRINCIRQKNNILITGSNDFTIKMTDRNTGKLIQKFTKPGAEFNCLDLSEDILCAAHTSKLVFWDLRKMKQRSEFNESFNGEITSLQFDPVTPTCFMGCSVDGMISKFDLTQPDEEEAFTWCTKILQSPSKLQFINNVTLVETTNHVLYLLEEEAVKKKIVVNNFQEPKHILNSKLHFRNNNYQIQYFSWNLEKQLIEKWYNEQVVGYVSHVEDSQIFVPLSQKKVLYLSENGDVFIEKIRSSLDSKPNESLQKPQETKQQRNVQKWQKIQEEKPSNQNGFILNKPSSFKQKTKKFKPF